MSDDRQCTSPSAGRWSVVGGDEGGETTAENETPKRATIRCNSGVCTTLFFSSNFFLRVYGYGHHERERGRKRVDEVDRVGDND